MLPSQNSLVTVTQSYLLRCLRHYLNVRIYADFNLHTEATLSIAEAELNAKFCSSVLVRHKYIKRFYY